MRPAREYYRGEISGQKGWGSKRDIAGFGSDVDSKQAGKLQENI
jgi:hypothetical protein